MPLLLRSGMGQLSELSPAWRIDSMSNSEDKGENELLRTDQREMFSEVPPRICLLRRACANATARKFCVFQDGLNLTVDSPEKNGGAPFPFATPTLCIQRTTEACSRFLPAFSPAFTCDRSPFSVMSSHTSPESPSGRSPRSATVI